jgi:tetratricopeptide (TPR) repeat protein
MRAVAVVAVFLSGVMSMFAPHAHSQTTLEEARKQFRAGQWEHAASLYQRLTSDEPTLVEAHVELIRLFLEVEDVKGAIAVSSKAASVLPKSAPVLSALGDVLFRSGKVVEASRAYKQALEIDPKLARAWWGHGRIQRFSAFRKQARDSFIMAYSLDPNDADIVHDWAYTNAKPADIAAGLERHIELAASYRGRDYELRQRAEVASLRYLGDRKPCELATPSSPTVIRMNVTDVVRIPLPGGAGAVDIPLPETRPWINAAVNTAKNAKFTVATSGEGVMMFDEAAMKAGVTHVADLPGRGSYLGFAHRLVVGTLEFRNCPVTVQSVEKRPGMILNTDGEIGGGLFSDFLVTLNMKKKSMTLELMPPLPDGDTAGWIDAQNTRPGFTPMLRAGNTWLVSATMKDHPSMLFGINTRSIFSTVSREIAANVLKTSSSKEVSLAVAGRTAKATLRAADHSSLNQRIGVEMAGYLGSDFLSQYIVTIDPRNGLIRLQ